MRTGTTLLGSLTIPGRPERLHATRAFVAQTLADGCPCAEIAVLLTSELVSNSLQHSNSRRDGGAITVNLIAIPGGIRAEVTDDGSETVPALRPPQPAEPGRQQMVRECRGDFHQRSRRIIELLERQDHIYAGSEQQCCECQYHSQRDFPVVHTRQHVEAIAETTSLRHGKVQEQTEKQEIHIGPFWNT